MYTQCPHCQTIFGVSEAHLSAAYGRVRCGHCRGQFNAKRHLLDNIPEQAPQPESSPTTDIIEDAPLVLETVDSGSEDIEARLSHVIPATEVDYIDLSVPTITGEPDETVDIESTTNSNPVEIIEADNKERLPVEADNEDNSGEITSAAAPATAHELPEMEVEPPPLKSPPPTEELDAIFAALDSRLEALTEDTDEAIIKPFEEFSTDKLKTEDYQDAFGDPDNQTEDDIKASIETIFAAAEAELDKSENDHDKADHEVPLESVLLEMADETLQTNNEVESEDQATMAQKSSEDVFITEDENETENFELAGDDELIFLDDEDDEIKLEHDSSPTTPAAFEQEELPFALHEELMTPAHPARSWQKTLGLLSLSLVLLVAIGFQLALFRNVELANKLPVLKPYLVSFCQHLPCQFTGQRDVKRIHLTSRDVRAHPDGKNTILISAIFVNNAPYNQPYPDIMITLSDLTSTVVAQRRFTPRDYLASTNAFQLLKSGKPMHITLEVLDPGNDAVNFQFEFL